MQSALDSSEHRRPVPTGLNRPSIDRQTSRGTPRRPDLAVPIARVAVFVDGCFWLWCEEHTHLPASNAALWRANSSTIKATLADAVLRADKWRVLRLQEHHSPVTNAEEAEQAVDLWDRINRRYDRRSP